MRTSGRGGSESVMFIAPAVIFGGFFLWLFGSPHDLVIYIDRLLLGTARAALAWVTALLS